MDFGDISDNLPIIISIVVLILLQFFLRRKRSPETNQIGIIQNFISEVRLNLRLADIFNHSKAGKKFMDTSWHLYGSKLDFLDRDLQTDVSDTYMLIEDYNQQIASAKKFKSTSYLASIDIDRLKDLLTDTREGLEEWLSLHSETGEITPKPPGIFGDFTGR
jgi:hypothetical protein